MLTASSSGNMCFYESQTWQGSDFIKYAHLYLTNIETKLIISIDTRPLLVMIPKLALQYQGAILMTRRSALER
jgi:hypothetical protein